MLCKVMCHNNSVSAIVSQWVQSSLLLLFHFFESCGCCEFWPANTCLHMRPHGQKWWKTFANHENSMFSIMRTRGSCNAHEEKRRMFLIVFKHVQACVWRSKYTRFGCLFNSKECRNDFIECYLFMLTLQS